MREVPVDWCLGGDDLTEPRLSPSGRLLAHVRTTAGKSTIVVTELAGLGLDGLELNGPVFDGPVLEIGDAGAAPFTPRAGRGLGGGCFDWVDDATLVVAGRDGDIWEVALVDVPGATRLTAFGPDRSAVAPAVGGAGRWVAAVVDEAEVWRVDRRTGAVERVDDGSDDFCVDAVVLDDGAVVWTAWSVPDMPWDHAVVRRARPGDVPAVIADPGRGSASVQQARPFGSAMLWVRDDRGWNNVWRDESPLVDEPFEHAGPAWGPGQRSYTVSDDGATVAFTRNEAGFGRLCTVDVATGRVEERARGVHGQLSWRRRWLAAIRTGARTPTSVVLYDTTDWSRREIAQGPDRRWDRDLLVEPELLEVPSADGTIVHARLYPADAPTDRTMCWVHGGPTDQWQVTFMPRVAYWRSRGWNVLVPDHRGSTGFGRAYQQALRGRWGELDVADVHTVLDEARRRGMAHPARTVLLGGSAGGFTVLGVLARSADDPVAAAAVVSYPVSDLADLRERSHRFERHYTDTLVGDPRDPRTAAIEQRRSPLSFAARITTPLLVLHGADDPVVPVDQSERLVAAVRAAGGSAELHVYPGEGHGIRAVEHQRDEYARIGRFIAEHTR